MNIVKKLAEFARLTPDKTALVDLTKKSVRQISYSQLFLLTKAYAQSLKTHQLNKGAVVLLVMPLSLEFFAAMLAVNSLGLVAMVVDPSSGFKNLADALGLVKPALVVVGKNLIIKGVARLLGMVSTARVTTLKCWNPVIVRDETVGKNTTLRETNTNGSLTETFDDFIEELEPDAPALITFTSGTTGRAKAIARSHMFLQRQAQVLQDSLELGQSKIAYCTLPIFTLAFLSYGTTTVFGQSQLTKSSLSLASQSLVQFRPDTVLASPRFVQCLCTYAQDLPGQFDFVQRVFVGGAPVFASCIEQINLAFDRARVISVYGSTEAEPVAHLEMDRDTLEQVRAKSRLGAGICQGKPCPSVELLILPRDWQQKLGSHRPVQQQALRNLALSNGQIGEILVSGEHVVQSYLSGPSANKIASEAGQIWHATGDAGYLDPCGELYLVGRAEQQSTIVKDRYPLLIEAQAMTFGNISACAYVELGQVATLVVTKDRQNDKLDLNLLAFCREQNIDIKTIDKLPVDKRHQSKVLYQKLKTLVPTLRSVGADNTRPFLSFKGFDLRSRNTYS